MRQSAVILARVLGFIEFADLTSGGTLPYTEIVRRLVERYSFEKFPKTFEELDIGKGIEFQMGKAGDRPIQKFVIWDTLLVLETRINTDASKSIMEEILVWSSKELGINYKPNSIKRFGYVSDVTFFSDAPLLKLHPAVENLAAKTSEELSRIWEEPVLCESLTVRVGHDPIARKYGIAPFSIEHRGEARFSENKYFSEAPLPTDVHVDMLEQFEKDIVLSIKT